MQAGKACMWGGGVSLPPLESGVLFKSKLSLEM